MERRLPAGPLIGALGAVMLVVSLFLNWYEGLTAFTVFELLDLVLVGLALLTIVSLFGGLGIVRPASAPAFSLAVTVITILIVLSQVVNDPPAVSGSGPGHDTGIWIAVAGSVLMVVGAVLSWGRISLAVDVRSRPGGEGGADAAAEPPGSPAGDRGPDGDPTVRQARPASDEGAAGSPRPGPRWSGSGDPSAEDPPARP